MTRTSRTLLSRRALLAQGASVALAGGLIPCPALAQAKKKVKLAGINILSFSPMFVAREHHEHREDQPGGDLARPDAEGINKAGDAISGIHGHELPLTQGVRRARRALRCRAWTSRRYLSSAAPAMSVESFAVSRV